MSTAAGVQRPDSAAADRRSVEDLISRLPKTRDGDRGFDYPWEIRAFALAVAAHHAGQYSWSEFQAALIDSIGRWEEQFGADHSSWSYYEHWVNALEAVFADSAALDPAALRDRVQDVLCAPANRDHQAAHRGPVAIDPAISAV